MVPRAAKSVYLSLLSKHYIEGLQTHVARRILQELGHIPTVVILSQVRPVLFNAHRSYVHTLRRIASTRASPRTNSNSRLRTNATSIIQVGRYDSIFCSHRDRVRPAAIDMPLFASVRSIALRVRYVVNQRPYRRLVPCGLEGRSTVQHPDLLLLGASAPDRDKVSIRCLGYHRYRATICLVCSQNSCVC